MTTIGSINGVFGTAPAGGATADARQAALGALGEVGSRVLAWVDSIGGGRTSGTGSESGFRPDANVLARGGDVYGLGELGRDLASQFGGTPAEEGAVRRALEGFTREAVVQLAGLAGAGAERQLAGVRDALEAAGRDAGAGGLDGVTQRLDTATAVLARQNAG